MEKKSTELPAVSIRLAGPMDADLLVALGRTMFNEAFSEQTDPQDMENHLQNAFKVEEIRRQLSDDRAFFLLIEVDSKVAGYAYLNAESSPACAKDPNPIQLVRLYLGQDYYGRNVGNSLMKACLETARSKGFETVWLSSWELNHRANAFYKKWEFEIVGRAKFKVGNDIQNDFIFARRI